MQVESAMSCAYRLRGDRCQMPGKRVGKKDALVDRDLVDGPSGRDRRLGRSRSRVRIVERKASRRARKSRHRAARRDYKRGCGDGTPPLPHPRQECSLGDLKTREQYRRFCRPAHWRECGDGPHYDAHRENPACGRFTERPGKLSTRTAPRFAVWTAQRRYRDGDYRRAHGRLCRSRGKRQSRPQTRAA